MAKYRSLSKEELNHLEKEFVDYLIINGFTGDDWEKMKIQTPDRADKIVDLFSDVVLEGAMRKIEYLEFRDSSRFLTFQCNKENILLVGMSLEDTSEGDFNDPKFLKKSLVNPPASLKVFSKENDYTQEREMELFKMMNGGCTPSNGEVFKTLCMLLPEKFNA
ncbi:MAG: hypothetical protein ACI81S_001873 [Sphingobacteriales bacterium]|jgi:hypothetical protein